MQKNQTQKIEKQIQGNEQKLMNHPDIVFKSIVNTALDFSNRREQEIECMKIMLMK